MSDTCPVCGLLQDLCSCKTIAKEQTTIVVKLTKRRYGKPVTLVEGVGNTQEAKELAKTLKQTLACGGTVKDKVIELQGNQRSRVKAVLLKSGYSEDRIEIR